MADKRLLHLYRTPALTAYEKNVLLKEVRGRITPDIADIETEFCFNIETSGPLNEGELKVLRWLLAETFEPQNFSDRSFFAGDAHYFEAGPRLSFTTAWSANAVSICHACGLLKVLRIERSRRYKLIAGKKLKFDILSQTFPDLIHDRMTECLYPEPLATFETGVKPEPVKIIPVMEEGENALARINRDMGLGFDEWDIDYYFRLFKHELKRNPTDVECFDLSQSNSEHSRHWFFRGRLFIDDRELPESLMDVVKEPYKRNPNNSIIAFRDNSSAIAGHEITTILPENPLASSLFRQDRSVYHIIFTAETHNFPSGVAPFPGAETGTGGRIRDVHATGRGSLAVAGTAAYCVGNLQIPGYPLPWEHGSFIYPGSLALPLQIEIEASNGASDYGNKFGEPVIQGFTRSFGLRLPDGERREWIKPIMFTGGVGQIDALHTEKKGPEPGMAVVKIGGPAYRIGMGGGAASSMIQGENVKELDFNAVQRGDAEMEQKVNRVIRACVELGADNPIVSIHDQGAGGNCNVVKEIIHPAGAKIDIRKVITGDSTLSVLEIWGAEYQEQDALLIGPEKVEMFLRLCSREKVPVAVIGEITGDGEIIVYDGADGTVAERLSLEKVLGDMPRKVFRMERLPGHAQPLDLTDVTLEDALDRVLRLVSVGSKRFLTNKVDRSVTGLIARQQCAGPLQLAVSDVAVIAQSHFGLTGAAIAIGEQPVKGLINPSAMARMSVGEALTNIIWACISSLRHIKCSANWMWAPKLPGEGARLYDAAIAMRELMLELGIAVDGGKDSLSMASIVNLPSGEKEIVKSPGALVISAYAPCRDITKVVTPDLKAPGRSGLIYIDLGSGKNRLGGSSIAQCYKQVGTESPDVEDSNMLKDAFNAVQVLIERGLVLAGHDRSDGGLITTLLEMAFAGNCGLEADISDSLSNDPIPIFFSEELGLVIEYDKQSEKEITDVLKVNKVPYQIIGCSLTAKVVRMSVNGELVLDKDLREIRSVWEETSHQLDMLQANPECVLEEKASIYDRPGPSFHVSFNPKQTPAVILKKKAKPCVAVIREEGSNSDREMASAFYQAGFEPWDVMMTDLLEERLTLSRFKGIAFVGGFSYADVLDSGKGWAGTIRFSNKLYRQFNDFYQRPDTFSLSVCNGCQLAALLGWLPWQGVSDKRQPRFIRNRSGRFESRFASVKILESPAIMLRGMEDSVLGIWVAHGEGKAHFPDKKIYKEVITNNLAPVRYVDDNGEITETYPFNPNGSPSGIAALCNADGRHLAIMPHPERTFLTWQWPWMPWQMRKTLKASPWLKIFQNAREWCEGK
ncbi:MAG: phosphoribosylformylglycinamidine synthase [Dissulfurispiraceae bacterium]|jgi:phosphoribosylformylglycinamidine synthase